VLARVSTTATDEKLAAFSLIVPPPSAKRAQYGNREIAGLIPANSTLVFDVELLSFE
jgi:FKBP-type peptidyl-prolyl cis-trans isomerase